MTTNGRKGMNSYTREFDHQMRGRRVVKNFVARRQIQRFCTMIFCRSDAPTTATAKATCTTRSCCWECWVGTKYDAGGFIATCSPAPVPGRWRLCRCLRKGCLYRALLLNVLKIFSRSRLIASLFGRSKRALAASGIPSAVSAVAPTGWMHGGWRDGKHDYAFVHMSAEKSAPGAARRESRREVSEMLFWALIKAHFMTLMENRYLALSFGIAELHQRSITNKTTYTRYLNSTSFARWRCADRACKRCTKHADMEGRGKTHPRRHPAQRFRMR